jgi:uncharacterized protein (TIGR03067 family)
LNARGGLEVLATLLLLLAADAPVVDKEELKNLQGKWIVTVHEHGGVKLPAKELAKLSVEVDEGRVTAKESGELREGTTIIGLDPKAKPATLDLKVATGDDAGKVVKAIWKRSGKTLTVCYAEPGKDRPKEFEAKKDSGHTLMVLEKAPK